MPRPLREFGSDDDRVNPSIEVSVLDAVAGGLKPVVDIVDVLPHVPAFAGTADNL